MATDNEHNSSIHLFKIMHFHGITITEYTERLAVNKFYELVLVGFIDKFWEEVQMFTVLSKNQPVLQG